MNKILQIPVMMNKNLQRIVFVYFKVNFLSEMYLSMTTLLNIVQVPLVWRIVMSSNQMILLFSTNKDQLERNLT